MLKTHEQTAATSSTLYGGQSPSTISEAHITPAELAQAITSLEARRAGGASTRSAFSNVQAAIEELGVDATADEVLNEVLAHRRQTAVRMSIRRRRKIVGIAFTALLVMSGTIVWACTGMSNSSAPAIAAAFTPRYDFAVRDADGVTRLFSEIPDNDPVQFDNDALGNIMKMPENQVGPPMDNRKWWVLKRQGKTFLKVFQPEKMSEMAMEKGPVALWPDRPEALGYKLGEAGIKNPLPILVQTDKIQVVDASTAVLEIADLQPGATQPFSSINPIQQR